MLISIHEQFVNSNNFLETGEVPKKIDVDIKKRAYDFS
jgi:hypothetical protein